MSNFQRRCGVGESLSDFDRGLESADSAESIFGATTMKSGSGALTKAPCREAGLSQKECIYGV